MTIAILDHPGNPGFPTYWHARGYGLFAANPLGQAVFSEGKEKLNFTLKRGQNQLFRYRVLIADRAAHARTRWKSSTRPGSKKPYDDEARATHDDPSFDDDAPVRRACRCSAAPRSPWPSRSPRRRRPRTRRPRRPAGKVDALELYQAKCQACHMADGNSQVMPNMSFADGVWVHGSTLKEVQTTITNGVPGTAMVAWKEQLTPAEITALAKFVRKFDKKLK